MSHVKGEHGSCETVRIKVVPSEGNPTGIVLINQSDYDESVHELYEPEKAKEGEGEKAESESGKKGKKAKEGEGEK